MPLTLRRRPRSAKRTQTFVRDEVRKSLEELGKTIENEVLQMIESWDEKPKFKVIVRVGVKRWTLTVEALKDDKIGQIFEWVDEGTPGGYEIYPVNADVLHFTVPHIPKTTPGGYDIAGAVSGLDVIETDVFAKKVTHPGIQARNFSERIREKYGRRAMIGGFRSVVEAAIKRALYRAAKHAGV